MFQQVIDFRDESEALYQLLAPLGDEQFARPTQFKDWTIDDVIGHLHIWNRAAALSLADPEAFRQFLAEVMAAAQKGGMRAFEREWRGELAGRALLEAWREFYLPMCERFGEADPKARVQWAGPDMSVRSAITARHMETWAHGQEVYDELGVVRRDADRIKNIAVLGVNTFGWTFRNRGLEIPEQPPFVRLDAPSGAVWEFNEPSDVNYVAGDATEFCQVVTQTRNVADTSLDVNGETAVRWMAMAQCFAGPPEDPPEPGTRHTVK
ncbi:TIGR03084 family metal-binding protein [Lentisalinibacter salinarum]|uniref:TIGR03084 family metal-binding protein n=1 Tax=Lentisalinibacter salinarum TaxID=2992239 RepID=UPI00386E422D